ASSRINRLESMFGKEIMPPQLSEKEKLRYLNEKGDIRKNIRETSLTLDEYNRLNVEAGQLRRRIDALSYLIKILIWTRYVSIVLWPGLLTLVSLFVVGVVRGFDRNIIHSFLLGLAKVFGFFLIVLFVAVDFRKTLSP